MGKANLVKIGVALNEFDPTIINAFVGNNQLVLVVMNNFLWLLIKKNQVTFVNLSSECITVIKQPFHITNLVDVNDRAAMSEFLCNYQKRFRGYVKQAQKLAAEIDAKRSPMGEINTSFVTLKNIPMSVHG